MGETKLQQALEEFKNVFMPSRNFTERTRIEYQNDLEDLLTFWEGKGIINTREVSLNLVEYYQAELDSRGLAGSTRKRKTAVIRLFLAFLFRRGYITNDISKHLITPFANKPIPRILTQSEYQRLLKASIDNPRDTAILETFLQTGIRLSELVGLKIHDIELPEKDEAGEKVGGVMRIFKSGRKDRIIPLNSKVCKALRAYLDILPASLNSALFLNRFGDPLGDRGVQKLVDKLMDQVGIKGASVHSLRHTFATHHLANGTKIKTLQEVMGHQDIRTTEIYLPLANKLIRREIEEHTL